MQSEKDPDAARGEPESSPQLRNRRPTATHPAVTGSGLTNSSQAGEDQRQPSQAAREAGASLLRKIGRGLFSTHLDTASEAFARFEHDTEKRVRESLAGEANVERLRIMSKQKLPSEMDSEQLDNADWQGGYEWFCEESRAIYATLATLERTTDAG